MEDLFRNECPFIDFFGHRRRYSSPALIRNVYMTGLSVRGYWGCDPTMEE